MADEHDNSATNQSTPSIKEAACALGELAKAAVNDITHSVGISDGNPPNWAKNSVDKCKGTRSR